MKKREAVAAGVLKYCTGKPCRRCGLVCDRYAKGGKCVNCQRIKSKLSKAPSRLPGARPGHGALRRKALKQATPSWANLKEIEEFYRACPEGHEVDHTIPIRGKTVCGLHVIGNLQYLTVADNRAKSNHWTWTD